MNGNMTNSTNLKLRSKNENITTLFATNFAGLSFGAITNFIPAIGTPGSKHVDNSSIVPTPPYPGTVTNFWSYVCDIPINGTDTETGFEKPTGSPLYATVQYGVYVIDYYTGFVTNDWSGVNAISTIAFETVTIDGAETEALSLTYKAVPDAVYSSTIHAGGFAQQLWYMFRRNLSLAQNITSSSFGFHFWINDLSDKFSSTRNRTSIFETKTGHPTKGGSLRHSLVIIYANEADAAEFGVDPGTKGWEAAIDNDANSVSPVLTKEDFIRMKNFTIPVPQEEWFEVDVYRKLGSFYSDLTSGRFTIEVKIAGVWYTLFDIYSTTVAQYEIDHPLQCVFPQVGTPHAQRNIQRGEFDDKLERIFIGQYSSRLNTDFTVKVAKVSFKTGMTD